MEKDPFDYIQPHIISLGQDSSPSGSGTLVKFYVKLSPEAEAIPVYAVLTATHVLEKLGLFYEPGFIVTLSKPLDRSGKSVAARWKNPGFTTALDEKHYRYLKQNHRSYDRYPFSERDIALLILSIDNFPECGVADSASFFDLDNTLPLPALPEKFKYVFYKGACLEEIDDVLVNTGINFADHLGFKIAPKSKMKYIEALVSTTNTLEGASGSGLWIFYKVDQTILKILRGVVVEKIKSKRILAIDIEYLHNVLLPKVKAKIKDTWKKDN